MAMDFFFFLWWGLVSSGIMRDGRREGGTGGVEEGLPLFFCFFFLPVPAGGKCLSRSSVTIPEVKVTRIKNSFSSEWEVSRGLPESGGVQRGCNYLPRCEQPLLHDVFFEVVFVGPDCK